MTREDIVKVLLGALPMFSNHDWESSEKNNRASELSRRISRAVTVRDEEEMEVLTGEVRNFFSPAFLLFERINRLVKDHASDPWSSQQAAWEWSGLVNRARVVLERRDEEELLQIVPRLVSFLQRQNKHSLAKGVIEALAEKKRAGR